MLPFLCAAFLFAAKRNAALRNQPKVEKRQQKCCIKKLIEG